MVSLTPSHLIEHRYCARYTYFEHVLRMPQNEQKYGKVMRGRTIHDQRLERNKGYLRRRLGVVDRVDDCYLTMPGLRGIIDEVLKFEDGSFAPLDYKFAIWNNKVHETYRLQLSCYAMLVEANFSGPVQRGFLVYVRSKAKVVPVEMGHRERDDVLRLMEDCQRVITENIFPKGTKNKRQCVTCTYRNVCVGWPCTNLLYRWPKLPPSRWLRTVCQCGAGGKNGCFIGSLTGFIGRIVVACTPCIPLWAYLWGDGRLHLLIPGELGLKREPEGDIDFARVLHLLIPGELGLKPGAVVHGGKGGAASFADSGRTRIETTPTIEGSIDADVTFICWFRENSDWNTSFQSFWETS